MRAVKEGESQHSFVVSLFYYTILYDPAKLGLKLAVLNFFKVLSLSCSQLVLKILGTKKFKH